MSDATIHLIPAARGRSRDVAAHLTPDEKKRAESFVFAKDARRWAGYRNDLREILGNELGLDPKNVPLLTAEYGKPYLEAPYSHLAFNLSHSDDLAAMITCRSGPVGIDLEPWSRASSLLDCAAQFCHPSEIEALPSGTDQRAHRLLELWTTKEALLKGIGTGLSFAPQNVRIEGDRGVPNLPDPRFNQFRIQVPEFSGSDSYRMAVAVPPSVEEILIVSLGAS